MISRQNEFCCDFAGRVPGAVLAVVGGLGLLVLAGCGAVVAGTASPVETSSGGTTVGGRVMGGQQPINGATISLYSAGSGGTGIGALSLLKTAVMSDPGGNFNITNDYTCATPTTQVYAVSRGGNPGLYGTTPNPAAIMMAALGDCGVLQVTPYIYINEVTTVGAVWGLAQFMSAGGGVGSSSTNAVGLRNAFGNANSLVNVATGVAGGGALPAGTTVESSKLNTLADALAVCVNSDGTGCTALFQAAKVGTSVPSNSLDAAMNIVQHPASNVMAVYTAAPPQAVFTPQLHAVPNDWTMSVTFTGGGLNDPTALAVDSTGSVWTANYNGGATKFSPAGVAQSFTDASLNESYGITVDGQDSAWITNEQSVYATNAGNGSVTKFTSAGQVQSGAGFGAGGIYYPYAVAADSNGHIWVADFGDSTASLLDTNGNSLAGSGGYKASGFSFPRAVTMDANHNAWFASSGSATKVTPAGAVSTYACCNLPVGIAIDPAGNVWVADYSGSSIVEVSAGGTTLQTLATGAGIYYPESIAIDGSGNAWVTNYRGNSVTAFGAASGGAASPSLSPATGFGVDAAMSQPFGVALDASGDVWVSSSASNAVVQFVGLATPIKTPRLGPPVLP